MITQLTQLREFLTGAMQPMETLDWLQREFLPATQQVLNSEDVRRRIGLYAGERIPENERNLTDVRNRVSLIIEYELARIATSVVEEHKVNDVFWSYVVANRFPDLEVRTSEGRRGLRIEVKCLQSVAEEKSANFDTLRKDVHPLTDFLVVFLWEWKHDHGTIRWDRAPFIENVFVFHATSLAALRDCYWLNCPPASLGDGFQGFDLRYAINCNDGKYNQEEGNYGKLLRLWQHDFPHTPAQNDLIERTRNDYLAFQTQVIEIGFNNISERLLSQLSPSHRVEPFSKNSVVVGWKAGDFGFVLESRFQTRQDFLEFLQKVPTFRIFSFSSKYSWTEYRARELKRDERTVWTREVRGKGKKPKTLLRTVQASGSLGAAQVIAAGQDES